MDEHVCLFHESCLGLDRSFQTIRTPSPWVFVTSFKQEIRLNVVCFEDQRNAVPIANEFPTDLLREAQSIDMIDMD